MLDTDFKDRTLMKTITVNDFGVLLHNYKVNILLEEIWEGKTSRECDGSISSFSILKNLASTQAQKIPGKYIKVQDLFTNKFKPSINDEKYWF